MVQPFATHPTCPLTAEEVAACVLARPLLFTSAMDYPLPRKPRVAPRFGGPSPRLSSPAHTGTGTEGAPQSVGLGPSSCEARARSLFEAQLTYDLRRRERCGALVALAIGSALPWVSLMWPSLVPPPVRALAFAAWCGLALVATVIGASELRWYRRMLRRASELGAGSERPRS